MWYLDSTLVQENPAAAEVLLRRPSESNKYSEVSDQYNSHMTNLIIM